VSHKERATLKVPAVQWGRCDKRNLNGGLATIQQMLSSGGKWKVHGGKTNRVTSSERVVATSSRCWDGGRGAFRDGANKEHAEKMEN